MYLDGGACKNQKQRPKSTSFSSHPPINPSDSLHSKKMHETLILARETMCCPIALFLLNFFGQNSKLISRIFCTYIFQNRLSATGVLSRNSSKNSAIRTVFYFSSYEEAAALLRHLTDDRLRGVLRWTAACCCGPRVVCGFKNSFYSVELRTACHEDSPLFSFFISEFLTRLFSKQQHIMNSSLSSLVLQF